MASRPRPRPLRMRTRPAAAAAPAAARKLGTPTPSAAVAPQKPVYYVTVRDGETLAELAAVTGADQGELMQLNRGRFQGLRARSKLELGTSILLPIGVAPPCKSNEAPTPQKRARKASSTSPPSTPFIDSPPLSSTPKQGRKLYFDADVTHLSAVELAKQCLSRASNPAHLVCRESERNFIADFVNDHISHRRSGSLYISGKPGTGKTATVQHVLHAVQSASEMKRAVKVIEANCMSFKEPAHLYTHLLEALSGTTLPPTKAVKLLDTKYLVQRKDRGSQMTLLVLDEVDQLETRDKSVLYRVFEWAHRLNSTMVLVGIANGLDLTERVLPMLKGRGLSPDEMHFMPYSKAQLVQIIESRLASVPPLPSGQPVLQPMTIKLCAAKVDSANGDLRNCLDICHRTIELSQTKPDVKQPMLMMELFSSVFGSDTVQKMKGLPLQQKIVLIALYNCSAEGQTTSIGSLHEEYLRLCRSRGMAPERDGLSKILELMDCSGLIEISGRRGKKEAREYRVHLRSLRDDVRFAYKEDRMLNMLFD